MGKTYGGKGLKKADVESTDGEMDVGKNRCRKNTVPFLI